MENSRENSVLGASIAIASLLRLTPGHPSSEKAMAVILHTLGLSMNVIAKLFKISTPAVLTWIKKFAIANYEKHIPKDAILIESDEMWYFLKSKKEFRSGKHIAGKLEKLSTGNVVVVTKNFHEIMEAVTEMECRIILHRWI